MSMESSSSSVPRWWDGCVPSTLTAFMRDVGLRNGSDAEIWEYAKENGFVIASKDTDFRERSFVQDSPPKVICWMLETPAPARSSCCSVVNSSESSSSLRRRTFLCSFCQ